MRTATTHWTIHHATTTQPQRSHPARGVRLLGLCVGLAWCLGILSLPDVAQAQVDDPGIDLSVTEARQPARFEISAGVEGRFETDIDDGGKVEELRLPVRLGYSANLSDRWRLGFRINYLYNYFDFSGNSGFGALDPWEHVHLFRFVIPVTYRLSTQWQLLVVPIIAIGAESGAKIDDSISGGGVAGFVYTASPWFSIGLAVGAVSQIEDDASPLIVPLIHWQITPTITIRTEFDVSRGYGGTLAYRVGSSWHLKGGLSFQKNRFRLDTADGVGETSGVPLWGSIIFAPSEHFSIEWYSGLVLAGNIRLEDEDGDKIRDKDLDDPQLFLGLNVKMKF